ncbi:MULTISPECIES: TetR/AcrR family transcriptional regulator [Pseudomonas syringae group genomosp. 2]|uniref:TetR/AcrR family transcriptional regulator n=1 Tax=Pseudomonas syringae group genomosp. 2 TaxID=251698 RepID=UPI0001CC3232|nr:MULTISPECIES: TetR/AcrR family transcriptional regulator [Pseudomonas syringae group genomosp. 2]EGH04918.1 TetR family transcriptional regulator [Pseudomonas amygdali pv. aesculi str. 0893_23]KPW25525.1 TetR family transcriptional regulator [Pseudomonas amygdali pv. aesculi]KWT16302.1 TetR family transcriptional regulator [Pseudomonas amygdali pv. aesculi]KWT17267.1 TetR family transcriptional regulator [Pseudomonas amygdali pv. aesculi]KWT23421.1 TetR family transcriptional regulator [Pse
MKVRTEARREAIIDAAASVFLEMGYERASMNEVTKRMGGSKATIYSYFPSKEELFIAVVNRVANAHLAEAVSELAISVDKDTDAELDLRTLFTRFGERMLMVLINDDSALAVYRMVVAESGHSNIGTMFYDSGPREFLKTVTTLMNAAMQRGQLRTTDPHIAALQLTSLLTAETDIRLYQQTPARLSVEQIQSMVKRAIDTFMLGMEKR